MEVEGERFLAWRASSDEAKACAEVARFHLLIANTSLGGKLDLSIAKTQQLKSAFWYKRASDIRDGHPLHLLAPWRH